MKVRIAIIIPSLIQSGVLEVIKSLIIQNQQDSKIEYFLIVLKNTANFNNQQDLKIILGSHLIILPGKHLLRSKKITNFKKVINNIDPDIIHFNSFEADLFSIFISKKRNIKLMSTAHNMGLADFVPTYGKFIGYLMAFVQNLLYRRLDLIVGVSKTVAKHYEKLGFKNVKVILNGTKVNLKVHKAILSNIRLKRPVGVYSGNFEPRKNVKFLFDAYGQLSNDRLSEAPTLLVLGDDPRNNQTILNYKKKYNNSSIVFLGRVHNVIPYLKQADFLISPSLSEGLPMSVIEGMACNLPLILSNIPQHQELKLMEKEDIYFFNPMNFESLLRVLQYFFNNWSPDHLSVNNLVFKRFFSSKKMYDSYKEEYLTLKGKKEI